MPHSYSKHLNFLQMCFSAGLIIHFINKLIFARGLSHFFIDAHNALVVVSLDQAHHDIQKW